MTQKTSPVSRKPVFVRILGLVLFVVLLAGCGETTAPITNSTPSPTQYTTLDLGLPQKALTAPVIGKVPADQILHVAITFKANQAMLDQLGQNSSIKQGESQDAASLANSLGISDQTYEEIKAYFGVENATLNLNKLHTHLTIDAKASTFATLLQTSFVIHRLDSRTFYTPDPTRPPQLPVAIANTITAITGLDNYSRPPQIQASITARQTRSSATKHQANADCNPDPQSLVPGQVAHAYGYDQFWGAGWHGENTTVNLVEIDGFSNADISNYFACANFRGKLDVVNIDGPAPQPQGESTLDIDMLAGLAPAVHIVDYQTDISSSSNADGWTRINDALQQIINDNTKNTHGVNIVSISLGAPEDDPTSANLKAVHQSLEILTKVEHMTVFVASGDCGAFMSHVFNRLAVSYPASDPLVVSVGGTILNVDARGNRFEEAVWSDGSDPSACHNQWGSGGGLSTLFTQQQWQNAAGVNNRYSNGHRQLPDISAVAFDLAVYYQGQWTAFNGTSAATPIWAAGMALANEGLAQKKHVFFYGNPVFYTIASSHGSTHPYQDVTSGNNLYYPATPAWDYATGLGTPNLVDFFLVLFRSVK